MQQPKYPKKAKPGISDAEVKHEKMESPMAEGMEKSLKKEPEYQHHMEMKMEKMPKKNYKSGKGWCENPNLEGC